MARSNIDLGWLAGVLTSTPSATPNPSYNAADETPYTDPQTGQTSGVMGEKRYVPPTNWQRIIHPEQSAQIDSLNNQFVAAPITANQANDIRNTIGGQNASLMTPTMPAGMQSLTPTQQYLATGGDYRPTAISAEGRALLNNQANVPATLSASDVASSQNEATYQQRLLANQNSLAVADRESYANRLEALKNVGLYGRGYPQQQVQNIMTQEGQITPEEQRLQEQTLAFQNQMANQRLKLVPYTTQQMQNEAVGGLYESQRLPVGPPLVNRVNPDETISQIVRNPGGMNPQMMMMQGIKDGMLTSGGSGYKPVGQTSGGHQFVVPDSNVVDPLSRPAINKAVNPAPSVNTKPAQVEKPTPVEHLQDEEQFLRTGNVQDMKSFDAGHIKSVLSSIDQHISAIDSDPDFGKPPGVSISGTDEQYKAKLFAKKKLLKARDAITTKLGYK